MSRFDDLIDGVKKRRVLGEQSIDLRTGPGLGQPFDIESASDPRRPDTADRGINNRIPAFDCDFGDGGGIKSASGERIGHRGVAIEQRLASYLRVIHRTGIPALVCTQNTLFASNPRIRDTRACRRRTTTRNTNVGPNIELA